MGVLQSLKAKVIVGMVAILTVLAGFYGWGIAQQGRADATPPTTSKTLTDNGDGTYTLSLSVTGTASSVTTSNKADVIVVIDTSNSMNNHIEHETGRFGYRNGNYINLYSRSGNSYSQLTDDTYSGTVYYRAGTSYFTYTGTRYSVTRLAVAKDSVNSLAQQLLANNTAENPDRVQLSLVTFGTNASTRITGTTNLSNFQSTVNGLTTNGGTNWEDALQKANAVATRPGAEAYVIFVSDGNPTFWLNPNGTVGGTGGEGASNVATAYSHAVDDAQAIVGAGKHFYGIGVFGSVDRMQSLVTDAGAPANNYYSATDQAALNAAFTTIINEITNAFGYTNVSINDGLTGMTAAALVAGQPDGFTYTRSGGSYGGGTAWDGAPQATYNGSAVSWDLGSMTLENGVTYTVSFKVWPKQEAYDLVADLNNGFTSYDDLTEAQKEQIVALTGGGYGLKTNTEANISYTQIETITTSVLPDGATQNPDGSYSHDGFTYTQNADGTWTGTKETEGTGTFDSPDPMPLTNSKMMVTKTWNDSIDPDQRPDEVTLRILRDDDSYAEVVLNAANNWTQQIDVAPGLIVDGETLETGHDYTIEEVDPDYHFELDADPFHPMIVDGVLNKNETGGATVTATNDLKGRLNISKTVTHSSDTTPNPNQLFTYTIKIDESNDDDVWFSIGNSSGPIDVSGENRVTGATVDEDLKYYHAASGTEITVKIKGGENIYFLNLAAGSTYEVEEVNVPSAYTCTVTNSDSGATTSSNKTSGSIVSNTLHTVAYTNAYAVSPTTATIPVTKVLSIPTGQTGPGDITGEFTFTLTAADGTPMPDDTELTNPDADGGTVSFGDITYTKPGTYTYTVAEAGKVDGVNNDPQASKTITVVVTDNGDGTLSATVHGANPTPTDPANTTFTNSYATTEVSAQIPVTKTLVVPSGLTGPGDITGKYTFTLAAQGGAPMPAAGGETVTNPAATGGTASFGSITYDAPGEYTYIITEDGEVDGVTNDTAAETGKTVTVEVVDNGNGTLSATIKGADSATGSSTTFTNTYGATPATANIPVKKVLSAASGLTPPDITGAYTFTLVGVTANAPMPAQTTLTNPDANGGTVTFGAISFSRIGTYTYTVSEDGEVDGVTNDSSGPKTVTVTVTDDGKGKLSASVSVSADNPLLFTNTYNVKSTTAVIPVTKVLSVPEGLTGPASIKEAYTFTLTPQSGAPAPATSSVKNPDANGGTASFGAITFVAPGTYTYKITEAGTVAGVVNDPAAETGKTVTVVVVDNGNGTLTATVNGADGQGSSTTFTNTYGAGSTTASIPVTKLLSYDSGLTPPDITEKFTFALSADDGVPMPDVAELKNPNAAGGAVTFGPITYNMPGTYAYTVTEDGTVAGITNDDAAEDGKTVTVVVVDNGNGTLTATVTGADGQGTGTTFTNTYKVGSTTANIPVTKKLDVPEGLTGPDITEKFTFTLADWDEDETNSPLSDEAELKNPDADGRAVTFGPIAYDAPGTYTYIVTEEGTVAGVTNDGDAATGKTVTVEVVDNGDGTLTATVKGADGTEEEPSEGTTFTNTYAASGSVTLEATKVAVGFELEADQFSFELKDAEGNVLQTKTNDAAGKIAFDAISYSEAGTYNYTINEVVIDGNGIAEDTHVANVEVTVIDNGDGTLTATPEYEDATFTNTHTDTEKDVVSAGDTTTSVDGELVQAGDTLTYTITYANNTSGVATVTVTDAIPANTTYVDGSASDGGVEDNGTITWTIENVAAGATGTVTFQVTVDEGANGETIENAATVFDGENQSSSNAVTTSIPVKDVLDADDASVDGGSAQVGDTLTYEVTFTLTKDCTSVVVTDDVPANTTLVDGSVSDGGVEAGGTITWDLGALDAGTYTVSFQVTVDESAVTADAITNTASISVNNHSEVETNTTTTTTEKGGLTISKEILVPAGFEIDKDKVFTFTVSLVDKNGAALTGEYNYTGSSVGTIRNGGSIELKHGESITIAGLPAGTKYKIVETAVAGYTAVQDTFEAVIPNGGEPAAAAFKNKYGDDLETTVSFPVEKVLSVPDGLTGPDIREKYTFKLNAKVGTPMPDKTELKNPDATGGRVTFGPITYDTPGVYEYTVTEDGAVTGVVNDVTASKTVTVTVTDNGDGTLTATASSTEDGPLTFTNSYSVNSTTATITAKKLLEHADLAAGAFNFVLSAADGTPMPASPNATNAADGTVAFGEITYSVPGTFTYTIKETAGSATYFDYDGSEKTVTVEVVDNGDGTLTATVTGDGDDATFTNTYKAGSDEVFINAVKNVNGEAASLNMFEFTIAADDGGALPDETTVTNNGGSVTFGPIKYDVSIFDDPAPAPDPDEPETVSLTFIPVGIEGTIMRAVPYLNGVPRDELLVEIRKDDEGAWEPHTWEGLPSRDDEGNDIAFEVYYTVDEGTTPERASGLMLQLTGGAAAEPAEPTAPRVKVFHYTITETDGGAPGYTYDGHSEMVIVRVTDNGDGTLDTEVEYDEDGAVFNNAYEASGEAEIEATKVLNGTDLAAGQFEFGLFEGDTQVGGAVTNGADGSIVFTVPYSNVDLGTHVYTVRELVGTPQTGYTYDSSSKTVTVEVTDNGDGTLSTEVEYGGDMTFTNAYKPLPTEVTLEAEKVLEGRDLVTGEFDFMLEDEDGNVVSSGTNDASGKIAFSAIPITKAGTYIFTAYEVKGDAAGVTYDDTRFVYEVDVEDDGGQLTITEVRTNDRVLFTNTYAEPPVPTPDPEPKPTPQKPAVRKGKAALPKTGDPTSPFYSAILAGISVVAMLAGALLKVRPQEKRAVGHSATPKRGGRA